MSRWRGHTIAVAVAVAAAGCGRFGFADVATGGAPNGDDGSMDTGDGSTATGDAAICDGCPPPYRANAVRFETAGGDFLETGGLTGAINSGRGIFSAWYRFTGRDGELHGLLLARVVATGGITREATNRFRFVFMTCSPSPLLDMSSAGTYTTGSGWVHVLASWDLANNRSELYISDGSDKGTTTLQAGNACYTAGNWGYGGLTGTGASLDADVADVYGAHGTYLDLSIDANRRLFSDAAGKPVDLGSDCSKPTGTRPIMCFVGATATWGTNKGTGGGFTTRGDGIVTAPTSPSD